MTDTIIVQEITLIAFRTFAQKTVFSFPASGLVNVRGVNRDTAGSEVDCDNTPAASGAGKTNLLLAIAYAFDYCPLSAIALQSWTSKEPMSVDVRFSVGDRQCHIHRAARGSYLQIGEERHTSAIAIKAELQRLTGLAPNLLEILTFRRQQERGAFLNFTDSEKKTFLTTVLPWLREWETEAEKAQKCAHDLEKDLIARKATWDSLVAGLEAILVVVPTFEGTEPCRESLRQAEEAVKSTLQNYQQAQGLLKTAERELECEQQETRQARAASVSDLENQLRGFDLTPSPPDPVLKNSLAMVQDKLRVFDGTLPPVASDLQAKVDECRKAIKEFDGASPSNTGLVETVNRSRFLLEQVMARLGKAEEVDRNRKQEHDEQLKALTGRIKQMAATVSAIPMHLASIQELQDRMAKAAKNVCFNCQRPWDRAVEQMAQQQVDIARLGAELEAMRQQEKALSALNQTYESSRVFVPDPRIGRYIQAESKAAADLASAEQQLNAANQAARIERQNALSALKMKLVAAEDQVTAANRLVHAEKLAAMAAIQAEINAIAERIAAAQRLSVSQKREALAVLKARVAQAKERIESEVNALIQARQPALQSLRLGVTTARDIWGAAIQMAQQRTAELQLMQVRNKNREEQYARDVTRRDEAKARAQTACIEYETIQRAQARELDFARLVGREGYLGSIFDEILDEIAAETNQILLGLPNAQHITVEFLSESATKAGTTRREIKTVVRVRGIETTVKDGLSGGQRSAVEWATDLALAATIARRLGVNPGWMMIDEAFDGFDPLTIEGALGVLQTYAQDKLVLVVTHSTSAKEMFAAFIDIEFKDGESVLIK